MKYIDVSEHQGIIDWTKVKSEIAGAILRAGYGRNNIDKQFIRNITECNKLEIPCGAYWFSYAYTPEMAVNEAKYLLNIIEQYKVELPLAFDFEYDSANYAKKNGINVTSKLVSDITRSFCYTVQDAGYYVLNYANPDYLSRYFDDDIKNKFGIWLAQWPTNVVSTEVPPQKCQIWQYNNKGKINGIKGNVDLNESYIDFQTLIKEKGLNNLDNFNALKWACDKGYIDINKEITWESIAEIIYKLHGE